MKTIEDIRSWLIEVLETELPHVYSPPNISEHAASYTNRYTLLVRCTAYINLLQRIEGSEKSDTTKRLFDLVKLQEERAHFIQERVDYRREEKDAPNA